MSRFFEIHPDNPQPRLIQRAVDVIRAGGVIAYPTDSCYAFGCRMGDKDAAARIRCIRGVDKHHNMTLVCRDLSEIAVYAKVDNATYRLLKAHTPGPYTFILPATHEVPRRLRHAGKKTIGLRVPDHAITSAMLAALNEPLISATLYLNAAERPPTDAWEIYALLERQVDLVIEGGGAALEPTTVVDLTTGTPTVIRYGLGAAEAFDPTRTRVSRF